MKKSITILIIFVAVFFHTINDIPKMRTLRSDSGNISSFVEGKKLGESYFKKDEILSDRSLYNWYTPIYINFIYVLNKILKHNYYLTFWTQTEVFFVLFLFGCYLFGKEFFISKAYGTLFMLLNLPFIKLPFGGRWGIAGISSRPTMLFITILPFLLLLMLKAKTKNKLFVFYFILGLTFYIHPVSSPYWIVALWLTGWILLDNNLMWKQKLKLQLKSILIIFLTMVPYIIIYTVRYLNMEGKTFPFAKLMEISKFRLNKYAFKPIEYPIVLWKNFPLILKIMIAFSLLVFIFFISNKNRFKKKQKIIVIWILSLLTVGSLVPFIDQLISAKMNKFPYEIDLMRNYIFLPFLIYIIILLFFKYCEDKFTNGKRFKSFISILKYSVVIIYSTVLFVPQTVQPVITNWINGDFIGNKVGQYDDIGLSLIENNTLPEDSIFHFPGGTNCLYIRFRAKRALVYTLKDGGMLLQSGKDLKLLKWYRMALKVRNIKRRLKRIKHGKVKWKIVEKIISLARSMNADFLLISDKYKNLDFDFRDLKTYKYRGQILVDISAGVN